MSNFKPGPGFFAMVEQTKRQDMERRIRREFKDHGYMELRRGEDVGEQMDAAMKVSKEDDVVVYRRRQELYNLFKDHDYYYEYSDDSRVWSNGRGQRRKLQEKMKELDCSFSLMEFHAYQNKWIIEEMVPYKDGFARPERADEWDRQGWNVAATCESWTITLEKYNEIAQWLGTPYRLQSARDTQDDQADEPLTMAYGCICGTPFYACSCGAAARQEQEEEGW